jgi:hypothetical protein
MTNVRKRKGVTCAGRQLVKSKYTGRIGLRRGRKIVFGVVDSYRNALKRFTGTFTTNNTGYNDQI